MEKLDSSDIPPIDIVVLWVDDSDPNWQAQKAFWQKQEGQLEISANSVRYRDWGIFKYWFRCVAENAPWVRKIHLVTCGQIPEWLNTDHPKIQVDFHDSFMDKKSLPTFSSHAIELQMHKIKDLAECFLYSNDDMFLIEAVPPTFFFKNGIRTDYVCEHSYIWAFGTDFSKILHSTINTLNNAVENKRHIIKNKIGFDKWFSSDLSFSYRLSNLINYVRTRKFTGFSGEHSIEAYTKSLLEGAWATFPDELSKTITSKFRKPSDINQYLFRYWSIANGNYIIEPKRKGKYYTLKELDAAIYAITEKSDYPVICINDIDKVKYFEKKVKLLKAAFEKRFPKPSEFEKS